MLVNLKRFFKILRLEIELFAILIIGLIYTFIDRIKKPKPPTTPSNNILFLQIYGIGNFILSSTMQIAIRNHTLNAESRDKCDVQNLPPPKIFTIVHPAIKELAYNSPYIDEVIVYEDRSLCGKIRLINQLRKTNFALAIDLSGTYWTAWLTCLSRAPKRIGFNAVGVKRLGFNLDASGGLYTIGIPFNHNIHMKEFYEKFLTVLNIPLKNGSNWGDTLNFESEDTFDIQSLTPITITIHIGARQKERLWDVEKFSELINKLVLRKNAKIILLGGIEDIERESKILSLVNPSFIKDKRVISMVGKTTLYQLASIISKTHLFIGHDSGPMHIACAVKTKVVALFGPGVVELWRPWIKESIVVHSEVECRGCNKIGHFYNCKENICMSKINVEQVIEAVEKILERKRGNIVWN